MASDTARQLANYFSGDGNNVFVQELVRKTCKLRDIIGWSQGYHDHIINVIKDLSVEGRENVARLLADRIDKTTDPEYAQQMLDILQDFWFKRLDKFVNSLDIPLLILDQAKIVKERWSEAVEDLCEQWYTRNDNTEE